MGCCFATAEVCNNIIRVLVLYKIGSAGQIKGNIEVLKEASAYKACYKVCQQLHTHCR